MFSRTRSKRQASSQLIAMLLVANVMLGGASVQARSLGHTPFPCAGGDCMNSAGITYYTDECSGGYVIVTVDCNCHTTVLITGVDPRQCILPVFPPNVDSLVQDANLLAAGTLTNVYVTNPETNGVFYFHVATSAEAGEVMYDLSIDPDLDSYCLN